MTLTRDGSVLPSAYANGSVTKVVSGRSRSDKNFTRRGPDKAWVWIPVVDFFLPAVRHIHPDFIITVRFP